jgi:hypothetical protein
MVDRPILFSAPMVRALIAGTKTQTRRILKPEPQHLQVYDWKGKRLHDSEYRHWCWNGHVGADNWDSITKQLSPFIKIKVGDRLWVRETWQGLSFGDYLPTKSSQCEVRYAATDPCADLDADARGYPWRPSIFMPRHASRLTLAVTDVRIERLQDISEQDCVAEGIEWVTRTSSGNFYKNFNAPEMPMMAYGAYRSLWNHINGVGAWEINPWVVAYTFRVQMQNIDQIARAA